MSTVRRGSGFPVLAILLGLLGTVLAALGLLGLTSPGAATLLPMLGEPMIAGALLGSGALFLLVEGALILAWALWLSFALLRWLPWVWRCFSSQGLWRTRAGAEIRLPEGSE